MKDLAELAGDTNLVERMETSLSVNEAYNNFERGTTDLFENHACQCFSDRYQSLIIYGIVADL